MSEASEELDAARIAGELVAKELSIAYAELYHRLVVIKAALRGARDGTELTIVVNAILFELDKKEGLESAGGSLNLAPQYPFPQGSKRNGI